MSNKSQIEWVLATDDISELQGKTIMVGLLCDGKIDEIEVGRLDDIAELFIRVSGAGFSRSRFAVALPCAITGYVAP